MGLPDVVQTYQGVVYYIYEIHRKVRSSWHMRKYYEKMMGKRVYKSIVTH